MGVEPIKVPDAAAWAVVLSERELEVASLAACGLSNKQIARQLGVAEQTIKQHMHRVLQKLGLKSRYGLIVAKTTNLKRHEEARR